MPTQLMVVEQDAHNAFGAALGMNVKTKPNNWRQLWSTLLNPVALLLSMRLHTIHIFPSVSPNHDMLQFSLQQ